MGRKNAGPEAEKLAASAGKSGDKPMSPKDFIALWLRNSKESTVRTIVEAAEQARVDPDSVWREIFRAESAGEISLDWKGTVRSNTRVRV